jgi:Amt family ammonium transporter
VTGLLYGGSTQILAQAIEVTSIFVFAFGLSYAFFKALAALKLLRVSREVELQGLDLPEMGTLGYPADWEPSDLEEEDLKATQGKSVPAYGTAD